MSKRKPKDILFIPMDIQRTRLNHNIKRNYEDEIKPIKSFNSKERKKYIFKTNNNKIILKLLLILDMIHFLSLNKINIIELYFSKITLKVKGIGTKNILGRDEPSNNFLSSNYPNEIYINGLNQSFINYSYIFNETDNFVEMIWYNNINSTANMFRRCSDITEIDLSYFNNSEVTRMESMFFLCISLTSINLSNLETSQVTQINNMFSSCKSLTSINLENFNTNNVENMNYMFSTCTSLTSINLSHFITSKVRFYEHMFKNCISLTSINLSNFESSKVGRMNNMFSGCINLEYINMKKFTEEKLNESYSAEMFDQVPENVVICINESLTNKLIFPQIRNKSCYVIDCSDDWQLKQKKIISETGVCLDSCNSDTRYKYEYNGKCYENCSKGFLTDDNNKCKCELDKCLLCPNVSFIKNLCTKCNIGYYPKENDILNIGEYINCYKDPIGYYLDQNDSLYKECYYTCQTCEIIGDNETHNFLECKTNFSFEIHFGRYKNCYESMFYTTYINSEKGYSENEYDSETNKLSEYLLPDSTTHTTQHNSEYSITNSINHKTENYYEYSIHNTITYNINNDFVPSYSIINPKNLSTNKFSEYPECSNIIPISYKLINNEIITQKIYMTSNNNPVVYECKIDDSSNNNCNFVNIINNTEILNIIKDIIQSIYNPENCKSQIIKGDDNIVFQVTNGKNELDLLQGDSLDNQNISIIDLGTCETKLRKEYHINDNDSLIYLKQEKTNAKASEKNVQYEVFEPYNFTKLNLSICDGETVNIYVKLDLSEETQKIYENMKSMGYDMLNINDPFYQDICTPYNTENNTDIMLSDRIDYIYNNKDSQCQSNCDFSSYISNSLYINCSCSVVEEEKKEEEEFSGKKIYESFYEVLKYSNLKILKCFKLTLRKKTFQKNLGSIIVLSSFLIYFACLFFFIIKGITPLKNKFVNILQNKTKKKW